MSKKFPPFHGPRRAVACVRVLLLAIGVWWVSGTPTLAKDDIDGEDLKALAGYHLTMEKLDAFDATNKKIAAAMTTDPQLKKEMKSGILNVGYTLGDALGQFDARAPHLAALLKSAGMTNRDYVLSIFSVLFASTGEMMKQASPTEPLPGYIPADNVALAQKNAARFREVMSRLDSLAAREKKSPSAEDAADE